MSVYDVITIGDTGYDTIQVIDEDEAHLVCNVHHQLCQICFDYADKIPVKAIYETIGGNAANAAVGFSRLGLKTVIYTEIGKDDLSERIINAFKNEKISLKYVKQSGKTNRASVISIRTDRTIFSYHEKREYHLPKLDSANWIYLSSLKNGYEKVHHDLVSQIRGKKVFVSYNPGTYQLKGGIVASQSILQQSAVVIMNKEEAASWLKMPITTDVKHLLFALTKYGTKNSIITDGLAGSFGFDGINYFHCPICPQKAVETTGAGDSFATALSAALYHGSSLKEAMRWGSINSASVVSEIGAQAGLLHLIEMKKRLKETEKITATPILT